jgi:hypothetical protein
MAQPTAHIVVATPTFTGDVCCDYAGSLAMAAAYCAMRNIWIDPRFAPGFSLVEYARNWLVAEFLSLKSATHLMWIDADLFFPPTAIHTMLQRDRDVVCGVYTTKHPSAPTYPYTALGPVVNGLQEAERVPGGFMLMKRHTIEKVVETCEWHNIEHNGVTRRSPRFFDLLLKGEQLYGEDYIACARLRKAGFKIFVETDVTFKHYGRMAWGANLAKTLADEAVSGFEGQGAATAWEKNSKEKLGD